MIKSKTNVVTIRASKIGTETDTLPLILKLLRSYEKPEIFKQNQNIKETYKSRAKINNRELNAPGV